LTVDPALKKETMKKKGRQTMNQLFALTCHRKLVQTLAVCACVFGLCSFAAAGQPTIITFDPPGSTQTNVFQVNNSGTVVGWYLDANNSVHGFWRTPKGEIISYDAPGAGTGSFQGTFVTSINDSGTIAGMYVDPNDVFHGFLRTAQGKYTTFDAPDAGTDTYQGTVVWNINNTGAIAGNYFNTGHYSPFQQTQVWRSYVRAADGIVTEYDAPGAGTGPTQGTFPCVADCLSTSGATAGGYIDATNVRHGFIRSKHGDITAFDPPGSTFTNPGGINNQGEAMGNFADANGVSHGFLRDKQGRFTDIDVPGAGTGSGQGTLAESIVDSGAVVGFYIDAENVGHGFTRAPNGKVTTFDVPEAGKGAGQGTFAYNNNAPGMATGSYVDGNNAYHGFLWIP
jgi:hypothetical protein